MRKRLREKLKESLTAVLPIGGIVLALHFTVSPLPGNALALMLAGMLLLVVPGLTLFSLGTDMAMMPMGEHVGAALLSSRRLPLLLSVLFIFGFAVTAAEPDLTVLATQVPGIPNPVLIVCIAAGVGLFLMLAALRVLFRWRLARVLGLLYPLVFVAAAFSADYTAVAFDASAVTTGPVTVPFLLAIGAGFSAISGGRSSDEDNFGICGICSVGPILAVLLLGMSYAPAQGAYVQGAAAAKGGGSIASVFAAGLWHSLPEVLAVVLPILVIFLVFQIVKLRLSKTEMVKIFIGLAYLLAGLTVFLAGVNYGFMPAASLLGESMGRTAGEPLLIAVCLVIGACVVMAEPAVHVLTRQVESITDGAVSRGMMLFGMAAGVGLAMSMAMVRLVFGFPVWWILLPGYALALLLTRFVPPVFAGIAFDSGGVAAGAMSAAFVLPFTVGVCGARGGNPMLDAFGVVGLIAMMPPVTVQLMGVVYRRKLRRAERLAAAAEARDASEAESGIDTPEGL